MEQFIRYLYEYRDGKPSRNVGFVKVEQTREKATVHIHGKGLRLEPENKLELYIFFPEDEVPVGLRQGEIVNINPSVNYRLTFTEEDTGIPDNFPKIQGIILKSEKGRWFAAVWNDMPVRVEDMRIFAEPDPAPVSMTEAVKQAAFWEKEQSEDEKEEKEEEVDTYITPSRMQFKKIRRQDIALLPRCEWRLANNSFLLHGYYNYHHLMLIEDGDELWLGVPGIYHRREARAAEAFGFSRFIGGGDESLAADEKEQTEEFGYWCRKVRRNLSYADRG